MHNRFIGYNDFDLNNDHSRSAQNQNHKPASRKLQPTRHNFGIFIKEILNLWGECRKTCFAMSKSGRKRMLTCFVVAIVFPPPKESFQMTGIFTKMNSQKFWQVYKLYVHII